MVDQLKQLADSWSSSSRLLTQVVCSGFLMQNILAGKGQQESWGSLNQIRAPGTENQTKQVQNFHRLSVLIKNLNKVNNLGKITIEPQ